MAGNALEPGELVYDIAFVALVPTESQGQVVHQGDRNDVIGSLENYLLNLYGPGNFKITHVQESEFVGENLIRLPALPIMPKEKQ